MGASFGVLFVVMNADDQLTCDYSEVIDNCAEQPFYRTEMELNNSLVKFHELWMMKAQEIRNETEELKCKSEKQFMEDLTRYHHTEADNIIARCHAAFQECVDGLRVSGSWTTSTTSTTTTTTLYVYEVQTTKDQRVLCLKLAEAQTAQSVPSYFQTCITNAEAPVDPDTLDVAVVEEDIFDCTMCNSFCRAFNWTQLDPEYAVLMNYSRWTCGPKVCPWIPECGSGMNVHRNCSARGCPCERAACLTGAGGRRLEEETSTTTTGIPRRYVQYTTTTTYENLENNTNCTCKPGPVDIVLVGRPFKVFYADPASQIRRRRRGQSSSTDGEGRRLDDLFQENGESDDEFEERQLQAASVFSDLHNHPVEYLQGVHVEMEEEILITRNREYNCRNYFGDKYKYVYPRVQGDFHTWQAFLARQAHPDLGCGYSGDFKVTCGNEYLVDNETGLEYDTGNCTYKVDISTCQPPTYNEAVDQCFNEESWTSGPQFIPEVKTFLEVEELNFTVSEASDSNEIPAFDEKQCCEIHVGSECRPEFNYTGTKDGTWVPEMSYNREVGYFPRVTCDQQATLRHRSCPRVKINKISKVADAKELRPCRKACNLTYARQELENVCVLGSGQETYEMEMQALKTKIALMTVKRNELETWSRQQFPLVVDTQHVLDCIEDEPTRRFNQMGWQGYREGFDQLKLRYECRLHGCKANQCVKVMQKCPIPQMEAEPESMCGPFGDQNMYKCVDKMPVQSWGMISRPVGFGWLALSFVCFLASFVTILQEQFASRQRARRVVPIFDEPEEVVLRCEKCDCPLDADAINEGSLSCTTCVLESQAIDVCRNCGEVFEDPEDEFCTNCRQPRHMAALADSNQMCLRCGTAMDVSDAKCLECGWHPEDAIVVKANVSPLRATAQSAANERRIVPAQMQARLPVGGHE